MGDERAKKVENDRLAALSAAYHHLTRNTDDGWRKSLPHTFYASQPPLEKSVKQSPWPMQKPIDISGYLTSEVEVHTVSDDEDSIAGDMMETDYQTNDLREQADRRPVTPKSVPSTLKRQTSLGEKSRNNPWSPKRRRIDPSAFSASSAGVFNTNQWTQFPTTCTPTNSN